MAIGKLSDLTAIAEQSARRARNLRRRLRRQLLKLRLFVAARPRSLSLRLRARVGKIRALPWVLATTSVLAATGACIAYIHRIQWGKSSEALASSGILQQLEIATGAAVLGVIGIVFSLSIFSIQQVAERGTALTIREYAKDWVFRILYWTLAALALLAMLSALQRKEMAFYGACLNIGTLAAVFILLKIYFDRAIKFVDPHFTIGKVADRARKSLKQIQRLEQVVRAEVRYQRVRRRK